METAKFTSCGSWIKSRRKALDLTQGELATRVGCASITIQKIEANQRRPSKQMARLLAEHLEIPTELHQEFVRFTRGKSNQRRFVARYELGRRAVTNFPSTQLTSIPSPPTTLIGRDQEVELAKKRLLDGDTRLLTILGPPGVGKTRLAIQVASSLQDEFYNGIYFVSLAPILDPNLVSAAVAQMIGVNQVGLLSFTDRLKDYLCDKHLLLVLDNFEQVVAASPFVAELLSACPWLSILVTSRTALSIRGEQQFPLLPLELPNGENFELHPSNLMNFSAINLFVERSKAVRPDFILSNENAEAIIATCKRLDGLPLAIELTASRIGFLTPQELLEQFSGRRVLHTDGLRDVSMRHQTLYHAIDWSYTLLTPDEQIVLRRLSVFNNGWTINAVFGILPEFPKPHINKVLTSLVKNHLVEQYQYHGETRFTLLETIRAYAKERLADMNEEADIRQRHAEYYLSLTEEADLHLRTPEQLGWLDRLEIERGNLRTALAWFIDQVQDAEMGLRLTAMLSWFWIIRCHLSEGQEWLTKALQLGINANPILRARVLFGSGSIAWMQGNIDLGRSLLEDSVALYRELGASQKLNLAWALTGLAMVAAYQADQQTTQIAADESVSIARQLKDEWMLALALCTSGEACMMHQDYLAARSAFKESATIFRTIGDKFGLGAALLDWGYLDSIQGNYTKAYDRLAESIDMFHQIGERWICAITLNILGQVAQQQGDFDQATRYYNESLDLMKKMGLEKSIGDVLFNLAQLTQSQGHSDLAKRLFEECTAMFLKHGNEEKVAQCRAAVAELVSTSKKKLNKNKKATCI